MVIKFKKIQLKHNKCGKKASYKNFDVYTGHKIDFDPINITNAFFTRINNHIFERNRRFRGASSIGEKPAV